MVNFSLYCGWLITDPGPCFLFKSKIILRIHKDDDGKQAPGELWGVDPILVFIWVTVNEWTQTENASGCTLKVYSLLVCMSHLVILFLKMMLQTFRPHIESVPSTLVGNLQQNGVHIMSVKVLE